MNGRIVRLTPLEYGLLEVLLEAFPAEVLQEDLLTTVWGEHAAGRKGYLKLYVHYLRAKLGDDPDDPSIVNRHRNSNDGGAYRLELG